MTAEIAHKHLQKLSYEWKEGKRALTFLDMQVLGESIKYLLTYIPSRMKNYQGTHTEMINEKMWLVDLAEFASLLLQTTGVIGK